jgi:hypothetical protein
MRKKTISTSSARSQKVMRWSIDVQFIESIFGLGMSTLFLNESFAWNGNSSLPSAIYCLNCNSRREMVDEWDEASTF